MSGSRRYARNTHCATCGVEVTPGFLYCARCAQDRVVPYRGVATRYREAPGPNTMACCHGAFHAILANPLRMACCGRILELPEVP